jgi:hypothetical protein
MRVPPMLQGRRAAEGTVREVPQRMSSTRAGRQRRPRLLLLGDTEVSFILFGTLQWATQRRSIAITELPV